MNLPKLTNNERLWLWVLGGMLVAYLIYRYYASKPATNEIPLVSTDPPVRNGFDALNEAINLYDSLKGWNFGCEDKEAAFNRILEYNYNELRSVVNAYRKQYATADYNTFRKLVAGEFYPWICNADLKNDVLARLSVIGS